jgi:hypothetical protein
VVAGRALPRCAFLLFLLTLTCLHAQERADNTRYVIELKSGDSFRGVITGSTDSAITIEADVGRVSVRRGLIARIMPLASVYRDRPFHFLMPAATANGPGGFVSNYELGFFYGGFGIGDVVTISGGLTLVPGMEIRSQLFHINGKITFWRNETFENAIGVTYTLVTADHPYTHLYAVWTFPSGGARYSAMIFGAISGEAEAPIAITPLGSDTVRFNFRKDNNPGVAFGMDAPIFGRDDIRLLGELWNADVTKPQNSAAMLGVRLLNEHLSADFGLTLTPGPAVLPVVSFHWRF